MAHLEHRVTENLTQIGNKMEATDGGQILNEVEGGTLNQWGNQMKASRDGIIVNRVSKKIRVVTWIIIVSFLRIWLHYIFSESIFGVKYFDFRGAIPAVLYCSPKTAWSPTIQHRMFNILRRGCFPSEAW